MLFKLFFSLFLFATLCLNIDAASQSISASQSWSMTMTGTQSMSGTISGTQTISMTMTGTQTTTQTDTQTDTQTQTPSWTISPSVSISTSNAYLGLAFFQNTCPNDPNKCCLQWMDAPGSPADYYTITFMWVFAGVTYIVPFNVTYNTSTATFTGLNQTTQYTISLQAFRFIHSAFPAKSQILTITFTTPANTPCQDNRLGVRSFVLTTTTSSKGGKNVVLTWTNGATPYQVIDIDLACKKINKKKHGAIKEKSYMNQYFDKPGQTTWTIFKNQDVISCRIKNDPRVYYAGGCCVGCKGGQHHHENNSQ